MQQKILQFQTNGRALLDITQEINAAIKDMNCVNGLCHLFIQHTSASLIINENSDSAVLHDLENFMKKLIPDDNSLYVHTEEGVDDMPSHIRSALTQTSLTIPIINARLALGTWQAVYLWEHRLEKKMRSIVITITHI